jgi:hypothetical protein
MGETVPDHAIAVALPAVIPQGHRDRAESPSGEWGTPCPWALGRRLLTALAATNIRRALTRTWKRLQGLPPIDVLASAYPNADGLDILSVPLGDPTGDAASPAHGSWLCRARSCADALIEGRVGVSLWTPARLVVRDWPHMCI